MKYCRQYNGYRQNNIITDSQSMTDWQPVQVIRGFSLCMSWVWASAGWQLPQKLQEQFNYIKLNKLFVCWNFRNWNHEGQTSYRQTVSLKLRSVLFYKHSKDDETATVAFVNWFFYLLLSLACGEKVIKQVMMFDGIGESCYRTQSNWWI